MSSAEKAQKVNETIEKLKDIRKIVDQLEEWYPFCWNNDIVNDKDELIKYYMDFLVHIEDLKTDLEGLQDCYLF